MSENLKFSWPELKNDLLLRVIAGLPVPRVPVWMMRQAGRTDPVYRQWRERDGRPLEALFQDAEAGHEISLQPQRLGVDAIIMFQDILTPLMAMGIDCRFRPGPILTPAIRQAEEVQALRPIDPQASLPFVAQTLRALRKTLAGELPVLGFAGSPMTLAFFLIAGGSPTPHYNTIFAFIEEQPQAFAELLKRLTQMTITYLNYQIEAGAHAVQLFESWGDVIPRQLYERFVQPTHEQIFAGLDRRAPGILFVKECSFIDLMAQSGADVLSVGACVPLQEAQKQTGGRLKLQGNVDNQILRTGTPEQISEAVRQCLEQTGKRDHILNLNHGLLPDTPFENVQAFIQAAKHWGVMESPAISPLSNFS